VSLKPLDTIAELERYMGELKKGLAKCEPTPELDPADQARRDVHSAFCKALDRQIREPSWSLTKVASYMGVTVQMVCAWRDRGWLRQSQIPAWTIGRFPALMRAVFIREIVANDTVLGDGTNG
jgi:hypothetical protein